MHLFYSTDIQGSRIRLPEDEAKHCVQVLRHKVGDWIQVMDGKGMFYEAELTEATKKRCELAIREAHRASPLDYELHIGIAPPKNRIRFEWFLEKATEIGISEITPIWSEHSERHKVRLDRGERIILAAAKQCRQAWMPQLNEPTSFEDFLVQAAGVRCISTCEAVERRSLAQVVRDAAHISILIGPEGDFSLREIEQAVAGGWIPTSMGNSRLRTETAGIVACHTTALITELREA